VLFPQNDAGCEVKDFTVNVGALKVSIIQGLIIWFVDFLYLISSPLFSGITTFT
jgi:hypothetical protein